MKNFLKSYLFITVIIFLFMLELPTTNYQLLTAYADDDNDGPGNGGSESVSGGEVASENITGSATDEQGNTTTFDSQGNITGETGPDGSAISGDSNSQSSTGNDGGSDGLAGGTGGSGGGYTASGNAVDQATQQALEAQAALSAAFAAQEPFADNAALIDQIAAAQTAFNNAMDQLTGAMQSNFTNNGYSWNYSADGVIGAPGTGPSSAAVTNAAAPTVASAAAPAPVAAPPAPPVTVVAAPIPAAPIAPAPVTSTQTSSPASQYQANETKFDGSPFGPGEGSYGRSATNQENQTVSYSVVSSEAPGGYTTTVSFFGGPNNGTNISLDAGPPNGGMNFTSAVELANFLSENGYSVPGFNK